MSTPQPKAHPPSPQMSLQESVHALARLNDQMVQLNARLEYMRLMLKLGVR